MSVTSHQHWLCQLYQDDGIVRKKSYNVTPSLCTWLIPGLGVMIFVCVYVTLHGKTELVCTQYTHSHITTYLTFSVSYTSSVNCISFLIVSCASSSSFIGKLC